MLILYDPQAIKKIQTKFLHVLVSSFSFTLSYLLFNQDNRNFILCHLKGQSSTFLHEVFINLHVALCQPNLRFHCFSSLQWNLSKFSFYQPTECRYKTQQFILSPCLNYKHWHLPDIYIFVKVGGWGGEYIKSK